MPGAGGFVTEKALSDAVWWRWVQPRRGRRGWAACSTGYSSPARCLSELESTMNPGALSVACPAHCCCCCCCRLRLALMPSSPAPDVCTASSPSRSHCDCSDVPLLSVTEAPLAEGFCRLLTSWHVVSGAAQRSAPWNTSGKRVPGQTTSRRPVNHLLPAVLVPARRPVEQRMGVGRRAQTPVSGYSGIRSLTTLGLGPGWL